MFETLNIKLFGKQPVAKVSNGTLQRVIQREFGDRAYEVIQKLTALGLDKRDGRNRISAAVVKVADKDINAIDDIVKTDFRDILMKAEYPRCSGMTFDQGGKSSMKEVYLADWTDYSNWLNKG